MKIEGYKMPKSSFLSMEKDMAIISNELLKNTRLKKLLHYYDYQVLILFFHYLILLHKRDYAVHFGFV